MGVYKVSLNEPTTRLLLEDWENRLKTADYGSDESFVYADTIIRAIDAIDHTDPDFSDIKTGCEQLAQIEAGGGEGYGLPCGNEPVAEVAAEIRDTITILEKGSIPSELTGG